MPSPPSPLASHSLIKSTKGIRCRLRRERANWAASTLSPLALPSGSKKGHCIQGALLLRRPGLRTILTSLPPLFPSPSFANPLTSGTKGGRREGEGEGAEEAIHLFFQQRSWRASPSHLALTKGLVSTIHYLKSRIPRGGPGRRSFCWSRIVSRIRAQAGFVSGRDVAATTGYYWTGEKRWHLWLTRTPLYRSRGGTTDAKA